jgi:hypothetical protein
MRVFALSIVLILIQGVVCAQTPAPTPTPKPVNIQTILDRVDITPELAEKDIARGKFRFFTYGLMRQSHARVAAIVRKKHNIIYEFAAGCIVTSELKNRVHAYNERMEKAVLAKFGKSSRTLYAEAQRQAEREQGREHRS